jgi:hypothetical protein
MNEVYIAFEAGLLALPAMGLRSVIDLVCNEWVGDKGKYADRIAGLADRGYIGPTERKFLMSAVETGHAAVHRGYIPNSEDLSALVNIVEHLLEGLYILPQAAEKLTKATPKRKRS